MAVAEYLAKHESVARVIHPGHHKPAELQRRSNTYLTGGLVGFEMKGGMDAGKRFIDSLKMLYHVANIGDARWLAIHTRRQRHTRSFRKPNSRRRVSPPVTSGFRSASNTSATSSPISTRHWPAPQ